MPTFAGAEGRYEDYVYLRLLEREWKRPLTEADKPSAADIGGHLSPRASIVVLYWSYFETRIERLLRGAMYGVPPKLIDDTLQRYSAIAARMDRLYQVLFDTTYRKDLNELGYKRIGDHLAEVQRLRNEFAHGNPTAIGDGLVQAVVENLKEEHEAWIAVFNRRATQIPESK
ncbi:MAG: hypothetical protein ACLP9L_24025 [Thermoguttaceae bacterium]